MTLLNWLFRICLVPAFVLFGLLISCDGTAVPQTSRSATATGLPSPTPASSLSPTATSTPAPTFTSTPSPTPSSIPSPTPTSTPSPTPSSIPSPTASDLPLPSPESESEASGQSTVPTYGYSIVNIYPHDRNAFTQGLVLDRGVLFEGTGLRGRSSLRRVELETGEILQFLALPAQLFGEGITIYGDEIFQLTWKSNVGFVYDRDSFELLRSFNYPTEGWGLTHDGQRLIMSDGTATLHFLDPETLEEVGRIEVYDGEGPVTRLNELEYVKGEIFAHIWLTDLVARIDPRSGKVVGWIDLAGLLEPEDYSVPVDVLNGIAYDPERRRLFVTGKLWPKLFEIELVHRILDEEIE